MTDWTECVFIVLTITLSTVLITVMASLFRRLPPAKSKSSVCMIMQIKKVKKIIDCSKTVNFLKEKGRMRHHIIHSSECCKSCLLSCESNGAHCSCNEFTHHYPEKAIEIVQKWSDEHPQRTYLTELLKAFPNVPIGEDGTPEICPWRLGLAYDESKCPEPKGCIECWNQPIKESEK